MSQSCSYAIELDVMKHEDRPAFRHLTLFEQPVISSSSASVSVFFRLDARKFFLIAVCRVSEALRDVLAFLRAIQSCLLFVACAEQ